MAAEGLRVRTRHPEIRRDQLLDAAERMFAVKGFQDTTVADIAEEAGVAKGTFYLYFPSKEHCLAALKQRLADGIVDRFLEVLAPEYDRMARGETDIDVEGVARSLLDESFAYAVEHAEIHRSLFHPGVALEGDPVAAKSEETITECLTQAFTRMNELGVTRLTYPEHTARILFHGIHWALEHVLSHGRQSEIPRLKEAALESILRTLNPS